jgi:hypothetical protein
MAKKPETLIREQFDEQIKEMSGLWAESIQQISIRGTPDKILCVRGFFAGVELKTEDGELHPLQEYKLKAIKRAGGMAFVLRPSNLTAVVSALRRVAQGAHPNTTRRDQWGE